MTADPVIRRPCYALFDKATELPLLLDRSDGHGKLLVLFSDADSVVAFSSAFCVGVPGIAVPLHEWSDLDVCLTLGEEVGAQGVILDPRDSGEPEPTGRPVSFVQVRRGFQDEPWD